MKAGSTVSRRVSEFCGVALFAAALIWLISLATYEPTDPAWFFSAGSQPASGKFRRARRRISSPSCRSSSSATRRYLIPARLVVIGWHYFWCRAMDAAYTKIVGALLLFGCISSLLSLAFGSVDVAGKPFRAGGYLGEWLAVVMAEYLNRTGSIIVILTLLFLAIMLSTQFSLGRMFSSATASAGRRVADVAGALRGWLDERRRTRQRRALLAKQAKKAGAVINDVSAVGRRRSARPKSREPAADVGGPCDWPPEPGRSRRAAAAGDGEAARRQRRRCSRCQTRSRDSRAEWARSRFRRCRCSMRRRPSGRSTSASSWRARGCSRRSAASSPSRAPSRRFTPGRWSRRSSSSRTPA